MYKKIKWTSSKLKGIVSYQGESIEKKVERILVNKEPIKDGAPLIFTERKDGVLPSYNIRTDRFEVAVDAMDKVTKSKIAKRDAKVVDMKGKDFTGGEPLQAKP
ncbi:MAG: hypothetical protein [Microviridae sp.]|nr:MAG: hypothetical protein [Microviridae sp.]